MSEQLPGSADQLAGHAGPEQLNPQVAEVNRITNMLDTHVPKTLEDAQLIDGLVADVYAHMEDDGNKLSYGGQEIPEDIAAKFRSSAQAGINRWSLDSDARSATHAAANAQHPSELSDEQRSEMRAMKPDSQAPDSMVFDAYKQSQADRLKLDAEIADATGQAVAPFSPEYEQKLQDNEAAREAARVERERQAAAHDKRRSKAESDAAKSGRKARKEDAKKADARETARAEALDRVAKFIEDPKSEQASGAEIKSATGLSHEDMLSLGFSGFAEMKQAAVALNEQRAQEAHTAAYRAAGQEQADKWRAELEEGRREKAEAAGRVDALVNQYKFQHGGQNSFDKNPELAERVRADAIAQAEAEGLNVSALKPSEGLVVKGSAGAEEYTQALIDALERGGGNSWVPASEQGSASTDGTPTDGTNIPEVLDGTGGSTEAGAGDPGTAPGPDTAPTPLTGEGTTTDNGSPEVDPGSPDNTNNTDGSPAPVPNPIPTPNIRVATDEEAKNLLGTAETNEETRAKLDAALGNMEDSLARLAAAKKAVEMGVGRRGRAKKTEAYEAALKEVRDLIGGNESLDDAQRLQLKMMALERVSEIQVANAEVPGRIARLVQGIVNSRPIRFIKRHKPALYAAVAVGTVLTAAAAVATGGASLPAVAAAVGLGAAKGAATGAVTGSGFGALGARAARRFEHTAEATSARNAEQLSELSGIPRIDGESFEDYSRRVDAALVDFSVELLNTNTANRTRTVGKAALQGAISGAVMGGANAMGHNLHFGGTETTTHTQLTPEQVRSNVQQILDGDPSKLNQVPGLEHVDLSHMHDLSNQAANVGQGKALWTVVQNGPNGHLSNAATQHEIVNGMSDLYKAGFNVKTHGAIHWQGDHFEVTGNNWHFGAQAPNGGAYVIGPDGQIHAFEGTLNNGQQAAVLDLLRHGGKVYSHDQIVSEIASHVKGSGLETHATTVVTPHSINNSFGTLVIPNNQQSDTGYAAGVAGGVLGAAMATPERAETRPAEPGEVEPTPGYQPENPAAFNQVVNSFDLQMGLVTNVRAGDDALKVAYRETLYGFVNDNKAVIGGLSGPDRAALMQLIAERNGADESDVETAFRRSLG
jgi:hypothetical protein